MSKSTIFVIFMVYSLPAWHLRHRWRATIYRMTSWKVNVMPRFGKDFYSLVSNRYFLTPAERRMAAWIRLYLAGYVALLVWMTWAP